MEELVKKQLIEDCKYVISQVNTSKKLCNRITPIDTDVLNRLAINTLRLLEDKK